MLLIAETVVPSGTPDPITIIPVDIRLFAASKVTFVLLTTSPFTFEWTK